MAKSTATYWNTLSTDSYAEWQTMDETNGLIEQLTLANDTLSGDYTRLTRFKPGANTSTLGPSVHNYPEEIYIIKGRLYDAAFDKWLETGDYASRPPGEVHGPFRTDIECVVLEMSYPSQSVTD